MLSKVTLHGCDEGTNQKLNEGALLTVLKEAKEVFRLPATEVLYLLSFFVAYVAEIVYSVFMSVQVCRRIDQFVCGLYKSASPNKNVELHGRDAFKLFQHGITHFILSRKRVDGGWHISMARQLHIFFASSDMVQPALKKKLNKAFRLLFSVHTSLRLSVRKNRIDDIKRKLMICC